jgi:hypothetical protein
MQAARLERGKSYIFKSVFADWAWRQQSDAISGVYDRKRDRKGSQQLSVSLGATSITSPAFVISPLRTMKSRGGSSKSLYSATYRNTRDHSLRFRSSISADAATTKKALICRVLLDICRVPLFG